MKTGIKEDYVSFKAAMCLKEKGFDEYSEKVYTHDGKLVWAVNFMEGESFIDNDDIDSVMRYNNWIPYTQGEYAYLCPTIQSAMKWLREKHKLHIVIDYAEFQKIKKFCCKTIPMNEPHMSINNFASDSFEDAANMAIIYACENLIK